MLADAKFMCRNNLIIYHSKTCAIHSFLLFLFHVWNSRNVETRPIKCDLSFSYLSPVTTNNIITKLILSRFSSNSSIFPSTSELDGPSKPRHSYSVSSFPEKSEYLKYRIWEEYQETSPLKCDAILKTACDTLFMCRVLLAKSRFLSFCNPSFSTKSEEQLTIDKTKRTMAKHFIFLW